MSQRARVPARGRDPSPQFRVQCVAQQVVYLDGERAVIYRSRMNPSLGRNFEATDPLEWLARLSDHIPDPGQHRWGVPQGCD
jgi:hypothetical protein